MQSRALKAAVVLLVPLLGGAWGAFRVWESRPYNAVPVRLLFSSGGFFVGAVMATLVMGLLLSLASAALTPRRPR